MGKADWEVDIKTSTLKESMDPLLDEDSTKKKKEEWAKIKDGVYNYEISAIRKDNKHGHISWGWPSADDKIILFSLKGNDLGDDDVVLPKRLKWAIKITKQFCIILNNEERR